MEKLKINLMSGTSLEKPLITAFKNNNGEYVILDNEINGTMGLPIILVSKYQNNTLSKIVDKSPEWESVKESLRLIIAGNQTEYITINGELGAEDVFFTQLTLPVASFEALKSNYKPASMETGIGNVAPAEVAPVAPPTPAETAVPQPVSSPAPVAPEPSAPAAPAAVTEAVVQEVPSQPKEEVVPAVTPVTTSTEVVAPQPAVESAPVAPEPVVPAAPAAVTETVVQEVPSQPKEEVVPAVTPVATPTEVVAPQPAVESAPEPVVPAAPVANQTVAEVPISEVNLDSNTSMDLTADKEAFLKACENMFDALVSKFQSK